MAPEIQIRTLHRVANGRKFNGAGDIFSRVFDQLASSRQTKLFFEHAHWRQL